MANKGGRRGLTAPQIEHEIERCRELEHWTKVEVLADKLKSLNSEPNANQFVTLSNFLTGEAKLEQYLQEHPPLRNPGTGERPSNIPVSKNSLFDIWGRSITTWTRRGGWVVSQMSMNFHHRYLGGL